MPGSSCTGRWLTRANSPRCCGSSANDSHRRLWLALGASDLRGGIDALLALVVRGFALGAQAHHAYVFANRRADRLKVLVYDGRGCGCARGACRPAASPLGRARTTGSLNLTREQFDWLVAGLPWQRLGESPPQSITAV